MKKTSSVSLSEELEEEVKESIYKEADITHDFLVNLTTLSDNPTIPFFVNKTSLSIITRVPTTRFDQYLTGKEVMPRWKKLRIVELLNLLVAKPESEHEVFIKWVVKTVIEKRNMRTGQDLTTPKLNEQFLSRKEEEDIIRSYMRALQDLSPVKVIVPRIYFPDISPMMLPDLIVHNEASKTVQIIEFTLRDNPHDQVKKLDRLAYYLNYFSKKKVSEFEGAEIKGVIICPKPSKQLKTMAEGIEVTVKELKK